jgi:hypothetical protein
VNVKVRQTFADIWRYEEKNKLRSYTFCYTSIKLFVLASRSEGVERRTYVEKIALHACGR